MKSTILLIAGLVSGLTFSSYGQSLIIAKDINLPKDTATKSELINSLNGFLDQKDGPNKNNKFVLKEDLLAMSALLDELKGMDKNAKLKDDHFYKAYLTNTVKLDDNDFLVQFAYMGMTENAPVLRANFKLMAKNQDGQFYFYSVLKQNTVAWKTKKISNVTYHFKDTLDKINAQAYLRAVNSYDKRLKMPTTPFDFYFCDNFPEVLQVLGIDYKSNYNGIKYDDISSHEDGTNLEINGGYEGPFKFDPHDLWHDRLHMVIPVNTINRPVDEGCAYLYGGSWGIPWEQVLAMFKKYATENPKADWLNLYINSNKFADNDKPMYVAYVINALIVQKLEKEKGFAPVLELVSCGERERGDENYFKALEKVSGISKAGFNAAVWGLIKQ
jgi:hypothetical protein